MTAIDYVTLEVAELAAATTFYDAAFGLNHALRLRETQTPSAGFRGYALSLVVAQPSTVDSYVKTALDAGATELKAVKKSFWGYGGVVRAPDGAIWKVASSEKKNVGPPARHIDNLVLLMGATNVKASKQFYEERGLAAAKSFGSKYVEFATDPSPIKLALYSRKAAAKDVGVDPEGNGSHRITIAGDLGPFTDPDGFDWVTASS